MNERKQTIMNAALTLFADKGYHSASIQEIADLSGIAKGSFYNSFKSKEELLYTIFEYFFSSLKEAIDEVDADPLLEPQEKFIRQVDTQIDMVKSHWDFFRMIFREQMIHISKETDELIMRIRESGVQWMFKKIQSLYPELPERHFADTVIIMEGILHSYTGYSFITKTPFLPGKLAIFILNRMDSIVQGIMETNEVLVESFRVNVCCGKSEGLADEIAEIAVKLEQGISVTPDVGKRVEALYALQEEVKKERPRPIVLESLLLMAGDIGILSDKIRQEFIN